MPLPLTLTFFFITITIILSLLPLLLIALLLLLLLSTIIIIYFLFPSYFPLLYLTAWSRLIYSSLCTWLFFGVFCIFGWGGGGGFVLGQFSFRAPESLTLRTTNGEKITIKNRQLPLATQAKYNLIDLSVQVGFTVVQIYISLNPFMQSLYNIHCNFIYNC